MRAKRTAMLASGTTGSLGRETALPPQKGNFRLYLQEVLLNRCRDNPRYSLRAFAKSLNVSPSALSAMLNGKRPITENAKRRLGLGLGLSLTEISEFNSGRQQRRRRHPVGAIPSPDFQQVAIDTFAIISDWQHYAILELLKIQGFQSKPAWIASRLGVTTSEINIAIERLLRVELLERGKNGKLKDRTSGFTTDLRDGLTSEAHKRFQQQALRKAIEAISSVPLELRDNTSITMAINSKDLPIAREQIKDFRRELCRTLESTKTPDEVYQVTISLIPLTLNKKDSP